MNFDPTQIFFISVKSIIIYLFIVFAIRLFGKKELAQLSVVDLVFILLISNSVQNAMVGPDTSLLGGMAAATGLFVINYIFKWLLKKFPGFSHAVQGEALLLVYQGKVNEKNLEESMLSMEELEAAVREHGVTPRARVHHISVRGDSPIFMLTAPIPATAYALNKSGMSLDDMDLIEINEAFAPVVLAWQKETGADLSKVNVNGGAIALGHPLGATGTRLMTTMVNELERTGGRYGLQTMCEGGGQANVTIIERLG